MDQGPSNFTDMEESAIQIEARHYFFQIFALISFMPISFGIFVENEITRLQQSQN